MGPTERRSGRSHADMNRRANAAWRWQAWGRAKVVRGPAGPGPASERGTRRPIAWPVVSSILLTAVGLWFVVANMGG